MERGDRAVEQYGHEALAPTLAGHGKGVDKGVTHYVIGTEDSVLPPGEWQLHTRMTSRLGLFRLVQMPGGHELMFSKPKGLTDSMIVAGRD